MTFNEFCDTFGLSKRSRLISREWLRGKDQAPMIIIRTADLRGQAKHNQSILENLEDYTVHQELSVGEITLRPVSWGRETETIIAPAPPRMSWAYPTAYTRATAS